MRAWILFPLILAGAAVAGGGESSRLAILEPSFRDATVTKLASSPARFEIALERDMPTPGWKLDVDGVEVDEAAGRIVVRATAHGPSGMVAQVITPSTLRIALPSLKPRLYTLEIRLRRGASGDYDPAHAMVLRTF